VGNSELILVLVTDLVLILTAVPCSRPKCVPSAVCFDLSPTDGSVSGGNSEIDSPVSAISTTHMVSHDPLTGPRPVPRWPRPRKVRLPSEGKPEVKASVSPIRLLKVDETSMEPPMVSSQRRQQQARRTPLIVGSKSPLVPEPKEAGTPTTFELRFCCSKLTCTAFFGTHHNSSSRGNLRSNFWITGTHHI
jgi:hypothetical protein